MGSALPMSPQKSNLMLVPGGPKPKLKRMHISLEMS